jgi:hypothetical protein
MKSKLLISIACGIFFGCKSPHSTISGHDCSSFQILPKDSIFITGEHIHLLPEKLCSYEEPNWFVFEEDINDNNHLKND